MSGQNVNYTASDGKTKNVFGAQASSGVGDAGKLVSLNSSGVVDTTMMPPGVEIQTRSIVSSENLAASAAVNVYNNSGVPTVRNADNSTAGKEANGFVLTSVTSPAAATVYIGSGLLTGLTGLTIGARYYLGIVGAVTLTPPDATNVGNVGKFVQFIGTADSTTELNFAPANPIYL
jgi:hypothetical protein